MARASHPQIQRTISVTVLVALLALSPAKTHAQNGRPIAHAGLSRYAGPDPIVLDGTRSYDPDNSGPLSYTWRQISGTSAVIIDANTAKPTVAGSIQPGTGRDPEPTLGGFVQIDEFQECEFELVVSDGELISIPDTTKVMIVPDFGTTTLQQENPPFNPNKPTVIYFGGGDCVSGGANQRWNASSWESKSNVISFPNGYGPDSSEGTRTYYKYGDMIIVYLSAVAPDYKQPIQTIGWSTGGQPAIDVGIRLNSAYKDARYALNRVTQLDAPCRISPTWGGSWALYTYVVKSFLSNSVDGEQCWIDFYYGTGGEQYKPFQFHDFLSVSSGLGHDQVRNWYRNSLTANTMNNFNSGVVAGAYWSVVGPGKNLQLALGTDAYYFHWDGGAQSGGMSFYDEAQYPGRLPEPLTLVGPRNGSFVDADGAVFSCGASENAVGYQLLFGPDPDRVTDYCIVSDTPNPLSEVITTSAFEQTWWTVKAYDQHGSTIYADPIRVNFENLAPPLIENITTGQRYASVRHAIDDGRNGHEIVVNPGVYKGNIDFRGKKLTVRSADPNDSTVVAATILSGNGHNNLVTFASGEDVSSVLAGFTITDSNNGVYCSGTSPTITHCTIMGNRGAGIQLYNGSNPTISNCRITTNAGIGIEMLCENGRNIVYNYPTITNCTIAGNLRNGISGGIPTIMNSIIWANLPQQIADTQGSVTYSDAQGGFLGKGNIDADPLFADPDNGDYHLKSQAGRWNPQSESWIVDNVISPCIDAGDPDSPLSNEPKPNGGIINMGAYGGTIEASKSPQ